MTPHFSAAELTCKCGCGMLPQEDFVQKVEGLRVAFGRALSVSSAARCAKYNLTVSNTGLEGPHTTGRAIDLLVDRKNTFELLELVFSLGGFTGVGIKQHGGGRFVHLDDLPNSPEHPRPTVWSYA